METVRDGSSFTGLRMQITISRLRCWGELVGMGSQLCLSRWMLIHRAGAQWIWIMGKSKFDHAK